MIPIIPIFMLLFLSVFGRDVTPYKSREPEPEPEPEPSPPSRHYDEEIDDDFEGFVP